MLNGKFYTGLPPEMVERQVSTVRNRQESHFFWPDDSKVESAVENRARRRASSQLNSINKSKVENQSSISDRNEVDARQMFHNEFAKSSIQFYDNLQDNFNYDKGRLSKKEQKLKPKLTATKLELPREKSVADTYTNDKHKQVYNSKIQFYDFLNEPDITRNNAHKPKMDMNDKRDVQRNTKNSPKLQVKHNVQNLSIKRGFYKPEIDPEHLRQSEDLGATKPKALNKSNEYEQMHDGYESSVYRNRTETRRPLEKRDLKNTAYNNDFHMDYLDNNIRELNIRNSSKKHITYSDVDFKHEPFKPYYDERPRLQSQLRQTRSHSSDNVAHNLRRLVPNMCTGNVNQRQQREQSQQRQQQMRVTLEKHQHMETGAETKALNNKATIYETRHNNNNSNDSNDNNYINYTNETTMNNNREWKISPKMTSTATAVDAVVHLAPVSPSSGTSTFITHGTDGPTAVKPVSSPPPSEKRAHLRSSLCFSGDALVVDSMSNFEAPTSNARRKARCLATQRVSVGLPD